MIIFASDFHLTDARPDGIETFLAFLESRVRGAEAFYVLGDLFNLWIGPAQLATPGLEPVFAALRELAAQGTRVTLLHGNRDFLLGERESRSLGAEIPGESLPFTIDGKRLLLTHGDRFCTGDRAYQRMKKVIRSRPVRGLIRLIPTFAARLLARLLRWKSMRSVAAKDYSETSLCVDAVESLTRREDFDLVICGHVHQADTVDLDSGARLLVLSEWRSGSGFYAEADRGEFVLREFEADRNRAEC